MRPASPPGKRLTIRTFAADFTPRPYDVRRVRGLLGLSQVLFARFLDVDPSTVRSWEQGTRSPPAPSPAASCARSRLNPSTGGGG